MFVNICTGKRYRSELSIAMARHKSIALQPYPMHEYNATFRTLLFTSTRRTLAFLVDYGVVRARVIASVPETAHAAHIMNGFLLAWN